MKKRLLSAILATTCAVSAMSFASFADGIENGVANEVVAGGVLNTPTLTVTLPTSLNFQLNPYRLEITEGDVKKQDAILCAESPIKNQSNCAIEIAVTAALPSYKTDAEGNYIDKNGDVIFVGDDAETGDKTLEAILANSTAKGKLVAYALPNGMKLATDNLKGTETDKSVFVYVEMANVTGEDVAAEWGTYTVKTKVDGEDVTKTYYGYDKTNTQQLPVTAKAAAAKTLITLAKGDKTATWGKFRIAGQVNPNSKVAWTAEDKFDIVTTFTVTAIANAVDDAIGG